jgi:hypothetical protein
MIKTGDEKFFDARRALGVVRSWRRGRIGALWLRHQSIGCLEYARDYGAKAPIRQ